MPVMTQEERREQNRRQNTQAHANDRAYLGGMRDQIARCFAIRITPDRLDEAERVDLVGLHEKATVTEGWETVGVRHYGLTSRLSKSEQKRWRALVGKAAGVDFDALEEDGKAARLIRDLARRAMTPGPTSMHAPAGSAVLPPAVLEDVHSGALRPIDLGPLALVVLTFRTGRLHEQAEKRGDVAWAEGGETLVLSWGGLHRLVGPQAAAQPQRRHGSQIVDEAEPRVDPIEAEGPAIIRRLTAAGWLATEKIGNELHVRLGARLEGQAAAA